MPTKLPISKDKDSVLFFVTIFEFPHATVRYQVAEGDTMIDKITTFDQWIELEAERIAKRTQMPFAAIANNHGQIALAALRVHAIRP